MDSCEQFPLLCLQPSKCMFRDVHLQIRAVAALHTHRRYGRPHQRVGGIQRRFDCLGRRAPFHAQRLDDACGQRRLIIVRISKPLELIASRRQPVPALDQR